MTKEQELWINKAKDIINELGEIDSRLVNIDKAITIDGAEIQGAISFMCFNGYKREIRDGYIYVMKDPNHDLSVSVKTTNDSVQKTNRLSLWVGGFVGLLTLVNVVIACLEYNKQPDLTKSQLDSVVQPLVQEIKELKDIQKGMLQKQDTLQKKP
jgi:hypothetical protein